MGLAEATRQFQIALEAHRKDPDDEDVWEMLKDAEGALVTAWMEAKFAMATPDMSERHYRAAQLADEAKSLLRRGDDRKALLRVISAIMELALTDEQAKEKRKVKLG